jgi:hypothetical protein
LRSTPSAPPEKSAAFGSVSSSTDTGRSCYRHDRHQFASIVKDFESFVRARAFLDLGTRRIFEQTSASAIASLTSLAKMPLRSTTTTTSCCRTLTKNRFRGAESGSSLKFVMSTSDEEARLAWQVTLAFRAWDQI